MEYFSHPSIFTSNEMFKFNHLSPRTNAKESEEHITTYRTVGIVANRAFKQAHHLTIGESQSPWTFATLGNLVSLLKSLFLDNGLALRTSSEQSQNYTKRTCMYTQTPCAVESALNRFFTQQERAEKILEESEAELYKMIAPLVQELKEIIAYHVRFNDANMDHEQTRVYVLETIGELL